MKIKDELGELCAEEDKEEQDSQKPVVAEPSTGEKIKLLQERREMYQLAEKNASLGGDTMKARRSA